jgi:hypothetical protein
VEAADQNGESGAAEGVGQIASAGELVGLDTHEADDSFRAMPELGAADALDRNFVDGFVEEMDFDVPGIAEAPMLDKVFGEPGEASEGVAGEHATPMANNVTIVVVLGGLDQVEIESLHNNTLSGGQAEPGDTRALGWEQTR